MNCRQTSRSTAERTSTITGATFCALPVRFHPVLNETIIGKLRCCFARSSRTKSGWMHTLLRVLAANVMAIYSPLRRRRRKPDRMTSIEPLGERLYTLDELTELRRNTLRYARSFPPGDERNQHRQLAVSLRTLFKGEKWLRDHVRNES
jgi:hypothetical protein